MKKRFYTPKEIAEELAVSSDTVLRLIASGRLPAVRVSARIYRVPAPAFEAFRAGRVPARRTVARVDTDAEPDFGDGETIPALQRA